MPFIEAPDELAEWLADKVGVYGGHDEKCDGPGAAKVCRICWTEDVIVRIRASVKNESTTPSSTPATEEVR